MDFIGLVYCPHIAEPDLIYFELLICNVTSQVQDLYIDNELALETF